MVNAVNKAKEGMLTAKDYKLIDFYGAYEKIIIPLYQRAYSWEDKNMDVFIKDIYENNDYYIGNIMALPNDGDVELKIVTDDQYYYIDDGYTLTRYPDLESAILSVVS